MTITAAQAKTFAEAVGGDSSQLELRSSEWYVNEAGRALVNCHNWNWLVAPPVWVAFVADQEWVSMPADFGRAISIVPGQDEGIGFKLTEFDILMDNRVNGLGYSWGFIGAFTYTFPSPGGGDGSPRLELYPTPTTTLAQALKLVYRRKWHEVSTQSPASDGNLHLPVELEGLYFRFLRETVLGFEEDRALSLEERYAQIKMSPMFNDAKRWDNRVVSLGRGSPMAGGIGQTERFDGWNYPGSITTVE